MTSETYLICIISGILGQLFHVAIRVVKLAKRAKLANAEFSVGQYFNDDKWPIGLNLLALVITVYLTPEIVKIRPDVMEYLRFSFIAFGYTGSSLLSTVLSKAETKINSIINEKTDKADGIH